MSKLAEKRAEYGSFSDMAGQRAVAAGLSEAATGILPGWKVRWLV